MPSEETNHHESNNQVEYRVGGGHSSFDEKWEGGDLEGVGGYGYGPCGTVFGLQRVEVILE
jgi:hypothetical protein